MTLLQGADSVELKLTVPDGDQRSAVQALQMDPLEAEVRQVFFFDTPDLTLNQHGVIVRARRTPGGDDSVVKLRPVVPSEVPDHLRALKGFGVEVDAMPGGFVCSGRLKAKLRAGKVKEAVTGRAVPGVALRQAAARLLRGHRPRRGLPRRPRHPRPHHGDEAEVLARPGTTAGSSPSSGSTRTVHASSSCRRRRRRPTTFDVAARTRQFLEHRGVNLSGEQQTKTKTALEYFSSELR